jgi:hypothetical protein
MASNSFNNSNSAKYDLAYARALLRDGVVPSFVEMLQKPAYAFRRVPHNSCRAVANPILCCSSTTANLKRIMDYAQMPVPQMPVPRPVREIHDPELEELCEILTQEPNAPPAALQDGSLDLADVRIVELGGPSTNAALPTLPLPEFPPPIPPACTPPTPERFVLATCCCPLGSIICIHAAKDTSVLTRSSCFSPKKAARKARKERSNASNIAEQAVLDEAVQLATNEWNALGVTDMRVSLFVHAPRTPFVHRCPVYLLAGASDSKFSCRGR